MMAIVFQMVCCKQWFLGLAVIVTVVAIFGALVGVTCWHMAYQEASQEAAVREQRAFDYAKRGCRSYVAKILQPSATEQTSETSVESEAFLSMSTGRQPMIADLAGSPPAKIGMLTSQEVIMYTAQEAIHDLVQGGLISITLQPQLVSTPRQQLEETLAEYVARLHYDWGVQVLLGWWLMTAEEVQEVVGWAKGRPSPRQPVILVLPSAPTGWLAPALEELLEADFVVLSLTPSSTAALPAVLLQMSERGVKRVLPLIPDTASADRLATQLASLNLSSLNLQILGSVRYNDSTSIEQVVNAADDALQKDGNDVGVLLTPSPDLVEMISAADGRQVSQVPWFIASNDLPNLLDTEKSLLGSVDLNAIEYHGDPVSGAAARYIDISERVRNRSESTDTVNIALVYDAVIIASRIGHWLTKKEFSLAEVLQRVSWESSTWAGLTGVLELTEDLERSLSCFTCVHLAVEGSATWKPTSRIQVSRSAHTITLVSSSADTYLLYDENKSTANRND